MSAPESLCPRTESNASLCTTVREALELLRAESSVHVGVEAPVVDRALANLDALALLIQEADGYLSFYFHQGEMPNDRAALDDLISRLRAVRSA
jgi:hypothetical protein